MLILTIYKTIITINYWDVNYDDEIFKSINYLTSLMCLIVLWELLRWWLFKTWSFQSHKLAGCNLLIHKKWACKLLNICMFKLLSR